MNEDTLTHVVHLAILPIVIISVFVILFCYMATQDLRKEVRELRAEHEAIEQNYCPTCGTYLGEDK